MSVNITGKSGAKTTLTQDTKFGLLLADPDSAVRSDDWTSAGDVQVGDGFILAVKCSGAGPNFSISSKDSPFKFKVALAWTVMTAAGAAGDTVKLQNGDGASTETFASITDTLSVAAAADKDVTLFTTIDDAQQVIAAGGSLRAVTASSAAVDVYCLCMRVS